MYLPCHFENGSVTLLKCFFLTDDAGGILDYYLES